jgi:uncharacterized coiled-coil protein SlyX
MGSIAAGHINKGSNNTGDGEEALTSILDGYDNTATGYRALLSMISGSYNTATGSLAMRYSSGSFNTAVGMEALRGGINPNNNYGNFDTAIGCQALYSNAGGGANTANGFQALWTNIWGWNNTASGCYALFNATGNFNVGLGQQAGFKLMTGSYNIDIGNMGVATDGTSSTSPATIRIGDNNQKRTFIAGISGVTVAGVQVCVDGSGQLGVCSSSARFKEDIRTMGEASDALLALRPVTFMYKAEIDAEQAPRFGLIAEEVEKVSPNLVARDAEGKVYAVRYEAVNAMLLNEFLKEHRKVENQETIIAQLKSAVAKQEAILAQQQKTMETLAAGLAKVSAQIDATKPVPRFVNNRR